MVAYVFELSGTHGEHVLLTFFSMDARDGNKHTSP